VFEQWVAETLISTLTVPQQQIVRLDVGVDNVVVLQQRLETVRFSL
jgi:hypothetical protein